MYYIIYIDEHERRLKFGDGVRDIAVLVSPLILNLNVRGPGANASPVAAALIIIAFSSWTISSSYLTLC